VAPVIADNVDQRPLPPNINLSASALAPRRHGHATQSLVDLLLTPLVLVVLLASAGREFLVRQL